MPNNSINKTNFGLSQFAKTALLSASIMTLSGCFGVDSDNETIENAGGNTEVPAPDVTPQPEPENNTPVITSTSVDAVTSGSEYSYTVTATDADSDDLTMSSSTLPSWLTFDTTTGVLTGTAGDAGTQDITLSVTDGKVTVDQTFTITVSDVVVENAAAVITSTAVIDATEGAVYTYTLTATDADNDVVTLHATTLPSWLSFDEATGVLSGAPTESDLGDHTIFLMASDGSDETEQTFTVTVNAPTDVPEPPAGNLISNGTFEDATGWSVIAQNGDTVGDDMVTIANGVVTFSETSNDPWQQAAIYTAVELSVGSYQFDMDMTTDGIANAWGEVYIGATEPVDGAEYSGDLGKVLNGYNAWDCGTDSYSGAATASGCDTADNGQFEITTAGTYYVLFRSGGETLGLTGVVLDNWSLTEAEVVIITNGVFEDATGWTVIAQNGDTVGDDMVTIANGVVTFSETSNDPWQQAAIYTAVELSVGSYQFDMDMTTDGIANAWGEVYIGATEPVDGAEYSGDLGKVLNGYNAWDCGTDSYSGAATASGCDTADNGQFEITTAGTYYVLFRSGGETLGLTGVVLDNWSLTAVE